RALLALQARGARLRHPADDGARRGRGGPDERLRLLAAAARLRRVRLPELSQPASMVKTWMTAPKAAIPRPRTRRSRSVPKATCSGSSSLTAVQTKAVAAQTNV